MNLLFLQSLGVIVKTIQIKWIVGCPNPFPIWFQTVRSTHFSAVVLNVLNVNRREFGCLDEKMVQNTSKYRHWRWLRDTRIIGEIFDNFE